MKITLRCVFLLCCWFTANETFSQSFSPVDLSNLTLWLRADTGITQGAGGVSVWSDISGNGYNAIQNISGNQPDLASPIELCGNPAIRFNGTTDLFDGQLIAGIGNSSVSLFIVAKPSPVTGNRSIFSIGDASGLFLWHVSGTQLQFRNNTAIAYGGNSSAQYYLFTAKKDAGVGDTVFRNGILQTPTCPTATAFTNAAYSIGKASFSSFFGGEIAEIILYKSALSPTDRKQVEKYLFDKYAPPPSLGADTTINFGFCPITLATAGTCYSGYLWSTGATSASISVNHTGSYWVRTTDIFGRQLYDTINVTYPNVNISKPDTTICSGDTITIAPQLSSFTNYTFTWNRSETTSSIQVSTPGDYYLTVSDGSCIAFSDTITVTNDLFKSIVSLGADTSMCAGNAIGIKNPASGWNTLQFNWSTGSTDSLTVISTPGQFEVTVSNARGCSGYDTIAVAISGAAPNINFEGDTLCLGTTYFTSNTTTSIDTPVIYNWNFGNGNQSAQANPNYTYPDTGLYSVSVLATTSAGCSSSASRFVWVKPNPVASFQTTMACINNSYQFNDLSSAPIGDSINFWDWNFGDTTTHDAVQNPLHSYVHPNNSAVTLIISATNGCADTVQNILPVVSAYTFPQVVVLQQPVDNYQSGSQSMNFIWSPSQNAIKYSLYISTDISFTAPIVFNNIFATQYTALVPDSPVYYWKVKAYNICNDSSESVVRTFTMFAPSNLPNLAFWLEADNGLVQTAGAVSQWNDQSGNGFNATQIASNAQPVVVYPAELCGKPALQFDGIDDILNGTTIPNIDTGSLSLFLVGKTYTTGGNRTFFSIGSSTTGMWMWHGGTTFEYRNNASPLGTSITGNNYYLMDVVKTVSTNVKLYKNGAQVGTSSAAALIAPFVNGNYSLGKLQSAFSYLQGEIAEVILYRGALSISARQQVENYLFNKYSGPVNLGPDITVTAGFCPVQLNATNCYKTYLWSTNETTSTINVNHSGVYAVAATDIFGRISRDTVVVTFPNINLTVSDTTICLGDAVQLQTQLSSTNGYSFNWNTGDSSPSIQVTIAGNYSVQVSYGSCSSFSDTISVSIDTFQNTVSLGADTSMCTGNLIGIKTPAVGWGSFQFQWSTGVTTPLMAVPDSGNYSVTVTNAIGCKGTDTIHVTKTGSTPNVIFTGDTICFGENYVPQNNSVSTDTSHIASYAWDFGDGGIDVNANPTYNYAGVGNYPVTLSVVTTAGCLNSAIHNVLVKPVPVAAFQMGTACISNPFQFIDLSTAPQGDSITQWDWNFGDGSLHAATKNPSHLFGTANTYSVTLIATASNGCSNTITNNLQVVSSAPNPQAVILQSPVNNFQAVSTTATFSWAATQNASNYTLVISANSSFSSPDSIKGISGTQITTTVSGSQIFYWKVIAYNICNAFSESEVRTFTLFTPSFLPNLALWLAADVGVTQSGGSVSQWNDQSVNHLDAVQPTPSNQPDLVNPTQLVKPALKFFGSDSLLGPIIPQLDNSSMSLFILCKTNATAGNRTFFAAGDAGGGMWVWTSSGVHYEFRNTPAPGANWQAPGLYDFIPNNYCLLDVVKTFNTDLTLYRNSVMATTTTFPPALTGSFTNGSYCIGKLPSTPTAGGFSFMDGEIAEIVLYKNKLSNTERQQVENYLYNKYSPPVDLGPDVTQSYSLCPVTIDAGIRFIDYLWSTGETTPTISVNKTGDYSVTVTDVFNRSSTDDINITLPYVSMSPVDTTICLGQATAIHPILLSPASGYTFLWGDSSMSYTVQKDTTGNYSVLITDTSANHCSVISDITHVAIDTISLLSILPDDTVMCIGNDLAINTGVYTPAQVLWSTSATASFITIASAGIYSVSVTDIYGCTTSDIANVTTKGTAPVGAFTEGLACYGEATQFTDTTHEVQPDHINRWDWNFGDITIDSVKNPLHAFPAPGVYAVTLVLYTDSGCTGVSIKNISVYAKPVAWYSYPGIICAGNSSKLYDNSSVLPPDSISVWLWRFNQTDLFNTPNVSYNFPLQGNVPVTLVVTTNEGCVDSISSSVEVFPTLNADFSFSGVCVGDSTKFVDITSSLSVVSWQWNYGDGSFFSPLQNPAHRYLASGLYNVKLAIENAIGCTDTVAKQILIVQKPIANFSNLSLCEDLNYTPLDSSVSPSEAIHFWDWNINGTVFHHIFAPQYYFADTGSYAVKLLVTTNSGCQDSIAKTVQVHPNPVSAFAMAPLYGEAPVDITLTNHSSGAIGYDWNFGDGSAHSFVANTSHTYTTNDSFNIVLTVTSDFGCTNNSAQMFYVSHTDLDLSVDVVEATMQTQTDGSVLVGIKTLMSNVGTRAITHIHLYATLGTGGLITEDWNGVLPSGQVMQYTFTAQFVSSASRANSYVCVEAKTVNHGETETRTDNNRQCTSLTGTIQLVGPSPNPAFNQSALGIILPKEGNIVIEIADVLGHLVVPKTELDLPEGRTDFEIPTGLMLPAEYFIRVTYNDEKTVRKFILQK